MCGVHHEGEAETEAVAEVAAVEEITRADVEIARINADKEIRLAKIAAGIAESETQIEAAHAEGRAEGMQDALDAVAPDPEPVAPVIVDAPEPDPEPVVDPLAPPVMDSSPEHEKPKRSSHGMSRGWFG